MSAVADAIQWAESEGVTLLAHGDRLTLKAKQQPPPELIAKLQTHKPEIVATLTTLYRNRLACSSGVSYDWLKTHYFTADDIAEIDQGMYPDPEALGRLIRGSMLSRPAMPEVHTPIDTSLCVDIGNGTSEINVPTRPYTAAPASPEWRYARDQSIDHLMDCKACHAPTSRYCAVGADLRQQYNHAPSEACR